MWSRRAAWESITTRRRRLAGPFLAPAADAPSPAGLACAFAAPSASAFPDAFLVAGADLVLVAAPPADAPSPEPFRAASASDSSALDWAAFASTPAALSAARTSLLVRP